MKKIILLFPIFFAAFILSGCSTTMTKNPALDMQNATVIKSTDGALAWSPKIKIDDKKTIAGIDVLSMAINPNDSNIIYIGTAANGLFRTKDGGETWSQVAFPDKVYGLLFDPQNADTMYGSGVLNNRAKIYKRIQEDQEWKEIYTEPSNGTIISSLAIDRMNPQVLYAGTNEGVIIKTTDGGRTWVNLKKAEGPIVGIGFDSADESHVLFGVFQRGIFETRDAGKTLEDISREIDPISANLTLNAVAVDPYLPGVVYVGTDNGIFRRNADESWTPLNIIESSKAFPIRVIAINPKNSSEILYSSAKAIYKSIDGGVTWSTFQLDTAKEIGIIRYDNVNPGMVYAGLRKF